jgi:hypothetical protein
MYNTNQAQGEIVDGAVTYQQSSPAASQPQPDASAIKPAAPSSETPEKESYPA